MRRSVLRLFVASALVVLVACTGTGDGPTTSGPTTAGPSTTDGSPTTTIPSEPGVPHLGELRFGTTGLNTVLRHPYFVALEMGYFEDEGLDVEFVTVPGGAGGLMPQLIAGNVDVISISGANVLIASDAGNDLVFYYTLMHQLVHTLIVLDDSGINTLQDLQGSTIGISDLSGGEVSVLRGMMQASGMVEGVDYQLLPVGEGGQLTYESLRTGAVDAYISSIFDVANLVVAGLDVRDIVPDEFRTHPGIGDVAMPQTYDENPDLLIAFSRAVAKGTLFAQTNPDAAKAIAAIYQPDLWEDEELANAWWDQFVPRMQIPSDANSALFGTNYVPAWEHYIELASQSPVEEGGLAGGYDLDFLVRSSLLAAINDFDHAAVIADATSYGQ